MFLIHQRAQYPNARGVYCIWNHSRDDHAYVGSSNNIRARAKSHLSLLLRGKHPIIALQQDYDEGHELELTVMRFVDPLYVLRLVEQEKMDAMIQAGYTLYNSVPAFVGDRAKAHAESCQRSRDLLQLYLVDADLAMIGSKRREEFLRSLPRW